jgi:dienelactone hydrolase
MAATTVLPPDGSIADRRFTHLPDTNTVFDPPMPTYASREAWERRKAELRLHILVSAGLFPLPPRTPLNARIDGRIEGDGYTIESVAFESYPGFYCTGNLYRPLGRKGPFPGIASPHGHWRRGRLEHLPEGSIPARGITLAKQGNVVFTYDMVGYNDSLQIPHQFESERAYLWGVSLLGLQLWNSIRVVDFLESLEDVDRERLGCTGASGGGTQTFLLTAVDDRIRVSVPVNMVSAHMQGGCLCENAPNLHLDATNVEIAAMMAPRPMLLVSATGDWTKNTPTVEYPAIRRIYDLYDAADRVACVQMDAGHNYNRDSRNAMYAWMGRWLHGELDASKLQEGDIDLPPPEAMLFFAGGKLPEGTPTGGQILDSIIGQSQAQLESLVPVNPELLDRARTVLGGALRHVLNVARPASVEARADSLNGRIERLVLSRPGKGDAIPALLLHPTNPTDAIAVLASPDGKGAFVADDGSAVGIAASLLTSGIGALLFDAFATGETAGRERVRKPHFLTFNQTEFANRVQDTLTATAYALGRAKTVCVVGDGEAGLWALYARAFAPEVSVTVADTAQLDNTDDGAFAGRLYCPGIRRAGDVSTAGILNSPGRLCLHNLHPNADWATVESAYAVSGVPDSLTLRDAPADEATILGWLGLA